MMPGFSIFVTLLMGLGALSLRRSRSPFVGAVLAAGVVVTAGGVGADLGWLVGPGVVVAAVTLGVLVGRAVPAKSQPMLLLLAVLSAADIIWIASSGDLSSEWLDRVLNFSVEIGASSSSIGTVDLILAAALSAHWLERDETILLSLTAAPLGMALANVYVGLSGAENLPLVPFITLGWLLTEITHRLTQNRRRRRT